MLIFNSFLIVYDIQIFIGIYKLNDIKFKVLPEVFFGKLEERLIPAGRTMFFRSTNCY